MRAKQPLAILVSALAGVLVAAGCGGSSMRTLGDEGDPAGSGGDAGTGQGGQGGSSNSGGGTDFGGTDFGGTSFGGSSVGGADQGGSSIGGTSVGGTSVGGSSVGGTSVGGSSIGGSGGAAGAGGVCSLPLVSGNCTAYFPSFGFSAADGNCQPFVYGGCGGNDNRFATLADCEATCGGPRLSNCPTRPLRNLACSEQGQICTYDFEDCLCAPKVPLSCVKIDPECTFPPPDAGVSPIVVATHLQCTCTGTWTCQFAYTGGR